MKNIICPLTDEEIKNIEQGNHIKKEYGSNSFQVLIISNCFYDSKKIESQYKNIIESGDDLLVCSLTNDDIKELKYGENIITAEFEESNFEILIINKLIYEELKKEYI